MEKAINLEDYKGRSQAYIKHSLLMAYLERLFMIIGQHENVIRYVDCFAGPWQEGSENLQGTSIAISLNIMKKCGDALHKMGKDVRFKALYIEKSKSSFIRLQEFLNNNVYDGVEVKPINGDFYSLRDVILEWCGEKDFTFFFIDPTGWKDVVEIDTLYPLLRRPRSEFLINFMFDFILRAHSQTPFQDHMKNIFGSVPNTEGMAPKQKEEYLLKMYINGLKNSLEQIGNRPRASYVKVRDPFKDRTKYDLVYITRHPKGIVVFMDESERLDLVQKRVRAQVQQENKVEKTGQRVWFRPAIPEAEVEVVDLGVVKNYWLKKLTVKPIMFGEEKLADMLEETGWFQSDFQRAFNELLDEGKVKNLNSQKRRPKRAVHFDKKEYLMKVLL